MPQRRGSLHLIEKPPKFFDKRLLQREHFPVTRVGIYSKFATKFLETTLLMNELGQRVVCLNPE